MLNRIRSFGAAAALAAVTFSGAVAWGQTPLERGARSDVRTGDRAERRQARREKMAERLGLTPDQQQRLAAIQQQDETELRAARDDMRAKRRALADAMSADTVDRSAVDARTRELSAARDAVLRASTAHRLKMRDVLTPEQRSKMRDAAAERRQRHEGRRGKLKKR